MTIEAALFDVDGALIDSNKQHDEAWAFPSVRKGTPGQWAFWLP